MCHSEIFQGQLGLPERRKSLRGSRSEESGAKAGKGEPGEGCTILLTTAMDNWCWLHSDCSRAPSRMSYVSGHLSKRSKGKHLSTGSPPHCWIICSVGGCLTCIPWLCMHEHQVGVSLTKQGRETSMGLSLRL